MSDMTKKLGAFSTSLAVKDLPASKAFYETIGFTSRGGDESAGWLVMSDGNTTLGLFQGMFEDNILTFNPGWGDGATQVDEFEDVRDIQKRLKAAGLELVVEADETTTGPAFIQLRDPDGNLIMFDQHV